MASRRIRDSVEFTSQTCTAKRSVNLAELNDEEQEQLSDALISELRAIASGHFVLGADPIAISTQYSVASDVKSHRINLLSLGAYTVKEECEWELDAQSNIATDAHLSQHQTSLIVHSELGPKEAHSGTGAVAHAKASGAYGSELAYSTNWQNQAGGYPLRQMLVNEETGEDEEEFEESFEEEMEEELTIEMKSEPSLPDFPLAEKEEDLLSHATSFSEFYVIDEREEERLKQVAFEKFMAEKAIEARMEKRQVALKQKKIEMR